MNVWYNFQERFLNIDNTFLKTFLLLFSDPSKVVDGYISGIRKRYMDPISYFGIALTLSGLLVFLTRKVFRVQFDMDPFEVGANQELSSSIYDTTMDFQALIFVVIIPMVVIPCRLLFNKRKYILTEHFVIVTYIMAHYTIFTFPLSVIILWTVPNYYMDYGFVNVGIMLIYTLYVYQFLTRYRIFSFILRSLTFLLVFFAEYLVITILVAMALIFTGIMPLESFQS